MLNMLAALQFRAAVACLALLFGLSAPVTPSLAQETPAQESPAQETPAQETPAQETPAQESPVQEGTSQDEAVAMVREQTDGKVLRVDRKIEGGLVVYRIRVLSPDGRLREFRVDAATGLML
jgi:uncharacterized membrane protein YkoI